MDGVRPLRRLSRVGSRYPWQIAVLRVAVGIWLIVLTAILYNSGHGGHWAWLLLVAAAVHFALAYRLVRIARRQDQRHARFS